MKTSRRYQVMPDRGVCLHPGCAWHRDGDTAEPLGEAHAAVTGHRSLREVEHYTRAADQADAAEKAMAKIS